MKKVKKLICTIGTGSYEKVTYTSGERRKETRLAPVAIGSFITGEEKGLELVALLTQGAREKYRDGLRSEAAALGWTCTPVDIPDGKSEAELWEIFEKFGEHLKEGDEVVLDLTHGFRHLPALLLSAVQYYAVRKRIKPPRRLLRGLRGQGRQQRPHLRPHPARGPARVALRGQALLRLPAPRPAR
ncbi:CRISPR-associated DxTHG motif protein [Rubrobacter xylanophilus]|uniref:CRISPR-associated DxTHG motif protein n=1 Tax=Rubrobacter xylanophilus TaxID=49319 RepID=UPI001C63E32F|nr:TM1812 family CRISPR-associated protein [Rubrobacter xylanophilus]